MKSYHKKAWKCAIIAIFILFFYTFAFAQTENIKGVQFKDGSVIYGTIIEMNTDKVIILTKDNETITKKFDDVVTFIKADEKESPKTLSKSRHSWEIGPEISYIEYKEPDVMSEKGPMFGIGVAYTYRNGVMIKVAGKFSYGWMDYQNSGTLNNIEDRIFEIRALGGYDFKISSSFTMTPFIGFGYRYLQDDAAGRITSTGAKMYLRESNYYYSPIGIEAVNVFDKGWSAGVILEYDYFWKGTQKSYLSGAVAGYNDVVNDQNSGYGIRGSIIIKKQTDWVFYAIEPFVKYWNIAESDIQPLTFNGAPTGFGIYEPKNNSTEIGVKFMIGF